MLNLFKLWFLFSENSVQPKSISGRFGLGSASWLGQCMRCDLNDVQWSAIVFLWLLYFKIPCVDSPAEKDFAFFEGCFYKEFLL